MRTCGFKMVQSSQVKVEPYLKDFEDPVEDPRDEHTEPFFWAGPVLTHLTHGIRTFRFK